MCLPGAKPIGQDTGLAEIKEMAKAGVPDAPGPRGGRSPLDMLRDFAAHVRSFVDVDALSPLKVVADTANGMGGLVVPVVFRSEEHTSELQSLMRISYAVFCLKKKK